MPDWSRAGTTSALSPASISRNAVTGSPATGCVRYRTHVRSMPGPSPRRVWRRKAVVAERWLRLCRSLAPAAMRERVFDPAVADLCIDRAPQLAAAHTVARAMARARIAGGVLRAALDCRRLAARDALSARAHLSFRERHLMSWIRDVHHAFRRFRRQPVPAAVAVLTLGLGLGANLAIFGQANTFLLSDIAAPDSSRLVRVFGVTDERQVDTVSIPDYRTARDRA